MNPALRSAVSGLLSPVRSFGRSVAWTPDFMGLGNLLQMSQWAYEETLEGRPCWIRATPRLMPWLEVFPRLRQVVLLPEEIRFTDRRVRPWSDAARAAGVDGAVRRHEPVDVSAVERFVADVLLPGSRLEPLRPGGSDELLVNVRRGDYYSVPEIRAQYGFDVESYVRVAVERELAVGVGPLERIVVVSDGIDWCRDHLGWLNGLAPTHFESAGDPVRDFTIIASSRRVVITNSTFSYWGAHVSNVVHGDNYAQVWAPRFFDRSQNEGRSWLVDERWSIVEDLPSGWDLVDPAT